MDELFSLGITDKKTWNAWMLVNHPDKGGNGETFVRIMKIYNMYKECLKDTEIDVDSDSQDEPPIVYSRQQSQTYIRQTTAQKNQKLKDDYIKTIKPNQCKMYNMLNHVGCLNKQVSRGFCKKHIH